MHVLQDLRAYEIEQVKCLGITCNQAFVPQNRAAASTGIQIAVPERRLTFRRDCHLSLISAAGMDVHEIHPITAFANIIFQIYRVDRIKP